MYWLLQYGQSKRWCHEHLLNYKGLKRAIEIREQLIRLLTRFKVPIVSCGGECSILHVTSTSTYYLQI